MMGFSNVFFSYFFAECVFNRWQLDRTGKPQRKRGNFWISLETPHRMRRFQWPFCHFFILFLFIYLLFYYSIYSRESVRQESSLSSIINIRSQMKCS